MKKTDQIPRTLFLEKYGGLYIYDVDMKKSCTIEHKDICLLNKYTHSLNGNIYHTYVTSTDQEYFLIHDDLFDQILATDQNNNISLKIIPKYVLLPSINYNSTYSRTKLRKSS